MSNIVDLDGLNNYIKGKGSCGNFKFKCFIDGDEDNACSINIDMNNLPDWIHGEFSNSILSLNINCLEDSGSRSYSIPVKVNNDVCGDGISISQELSHDCSVINDIQITGTSFSKDGETSYNFGTYQLSDSSYQDLFSAKLFLDGTSSEYGVDCVGGNIKLKNGVNIPSNCEQGVDTDWRRFTLKFYIDGVLCDDYSEQIVQDPCIECPNCDNVLNFLFDDYEKAHDGIKVTFPLGGTESRVLILSATTKGCGTIETDIEEENVMFDGGASIEYKDHGKIVEIYGKITPASERRSCAGTIEYTSNDGTKCRVTLTVVQENICTCDTNRKSIYSMYSTEGKAIKTDGNKIIMYEESYLPAIFYNRYDENNRRKTVEDFYAFGIGFNQNVCGEKMKVSVLNSETTYYKVIINSDGTYDDSQIDSSANNWLQLDETEKLFSNSDIYVSGSVSQNLNDYGRLAKVKINEKVKKDANWDACTSDVIEFYQVPNLSLNCDEIKSYFDRVISESSIYNDIKANPDASAEYPFLIEKTNSNNFFSVNLPILFGEYDIIEDECTDLYSSGHSFIYYTNINTQDYYFGLNPGCSEGSVNIGIKIGGSVCKLIKGNFSIDSLKCDCSEIKANEDTYGLCKNIIDFSEYNNFVVSVVENKRSVTKTCEHSIDSCYLSDKNGNESGYSWVSINSYSATVHGNYVSYDANVSLIESEFRNQDVGAKAYICVNLSDTNVDIHECSQHIKEISVSYCCYGCKIELPEEETVTATITNNDLGNFINIGQVKVSNHDYYINNLQDEINNKYDVLSRAGGNYLTDGKLSFKEYDRNNNKLIYDVIIKYNESFGLDTGTKTVDIYIGGFCGETFDPRKHTYVYIDYVNN